MRHVWPSRPALACSSTTSRLDLVLNHGLLPPAFCDGAHPLYRQTPSGQSRVYRDTQLCNHGVYLRESAGTRLDMCDAVRIINISDAIIVCMMSTFIRESTDLLGMVANPARGQLNRFSSFFPVPVRV